MIVARFQAFSNITLEEMKRYRSNDYWDRKPIRKLPGLCSTTDARFLLQLMVSGIIYFHGGFHPRMKLRGEVLVLDAEDTGVRCMDNQPVVVPREIILRISSADFLNLEYVRGQSIIAEGPKYDLVAKLLSYENMSNLKLARERDLARKKRVCPRWMDIWGMFQKR